MPFAKSTRNVFSVHVIGSFFLITSAFFSKAQNLVPNHSFEFVNKPQKTLFPGTIEYAAPWFTLGKGSPDLIQNKTEKQAKQNAADGLNYAGIIVYDDENKDFREYLQVKLLAPLQAGKEYCVSIKTSLARESFYSIDRLGILFNKDTLKSKNWYALDKVPQLKTPDYKALNDTNTWQRFEWKYVAEGSERFIVIGNFYSDIQTNLIINKRTSFFKTASLYVDDVIIQLCNPEPEEVKSSNAGTKINREGRLFIPNVLTPNQDGFNDLFEIEGLPLYTRLIIRDLNGLEILKTNNYRNDWDANGVPAGKYKYELRFPDGNVVYGVIDVVRTKNKK